MRICKTKRTGTKANTGREASAPLEDRYLQLRADFEELLLAHEAVLADNLRLESAIRLLINGKCREA